MRCGPARRWVQAQLAVLKGSKRWLRFFNGKRALRDVQSEDFRDWEVEQFADALALRSLRAAPGVWRLPVWEQAADINSECFSLGSWSIKTRIQQRTHTQLYGSMRCILDSIHQVRRRHHSGQSWKCRSRRACAMVMGKTSIPGLSGRGFKNGMFAPFCSPNLFWVFLAG